MKPLHLTLILLCIVGGLFLSLPVANGETSIFDGEELDHDKTFTPIRYAIDRVKNDIKKLFSFDIANYNVKKPEGSIFNVDFKDLKASINTGVLWEYIMMVPEAIIKTLMYKIFEFFDVILSFFNVLLITYVESINFIQSLVYNTMNIEWTYSTGAYSEGDQIYYRTVELHTASGTGGIAQSMHYIFGFSIGLAIMFLFLNIVDELIGTVGWDIPFI